MNIQNVTLTEVIHCVEQCTHAPKRVDVFGKGVTFSGRSDVSQAVAGPSRLQLCAVLMSSGIH
jgi:hypothetical protein